MAEARPLALPSTFTPIEDVIAIFVTVWTSPCLEFAVIIMGIATWTNPIAYKRRADSKVGHWLIAFLTDHDCLAG